MDMVSCWLLPDCGGLRLKWNQKAVFHGTVFAWEQNAQVHILVLFPSCSITLDMAV
jgi:hypothetical protein